MIEMRHHRDAEARSIPSTISMRYGALSDREALLLSRDTVWCHRVVVRVTALRCGLIPYTTQRKYEFKDSHAREMVDVTVRRHTAECDSKYST